MSMNEAPPPPTGLPMKRFKFVWRFLLLSNLALGAFLFARAKRRDSMEIHRKRTAHRLHKSKASVEVPPEPITNSLDLNYEDFLVPVTVPVEVRAPFAEEQQREVFKWMLEEKRKVKPMDAMEKKQIDEENVRTGLDVEQPPTSAVDECLSNCSDCLTVSGSQSSCTSHRSDVILQG